MSWYSWPLTSTPNKSSFTLRGTLIEWCPDVFHLFKSSQRVITWFHILLKTQSLWGSALHFILWPWSAQSSWALSLLVPVWLSLPFLSCLTSAASWSSDSIPSGSTDCPKCFHFLLGLSILERSQRDYVYECLGREMHVRKWPSLQGYTWPLPRKRLFTQISWSPTKHGAWYYGIGCVMGAWSRKNSQRGGWWLGWVARRQN